jgi:hypothetical protein
MLDESATAQFKIQQIKFPSQKFVDCVRMPVNLSKLGTLDERSRRLVSTPSALGAGGRTTSSAIEARGRGH